MIEISIQIFIRMSGIALGCYICNQILKGFAIWQITHHELSDNEVKSITKIANGKLPKQTAN